MTYVHKISWMFSPYSNEGSLKL